MKNIIDLSGLDLTVIAIYVVLLIGIAIWASYGQKNKSDNLFLANKSLGWFSIGLTMWGTNVGPSMLIANASSGFESGIAAGNFSWFAFPFICLLAFVFAPRYLGANVMTLPEYMGKRFGETTRTYIAWYSIITILISWLGLTLFSGGVFMAQILDYPLWLCIVFLVVISAAFTMAGGLKTIAYTNVYQMLLLIGVSILLAVMAIIKIDGLETVIEKTPESYWNLFQPLSDPNFPWLAIILGYPVMGVWFWCTDQSMVQSVLGAKNLRQGQLGANFCAWLKLIDIPLFIVPGILCFLLIPTLTNSTDAYLQLVKSVFPPGMIGLVVVIMSAALISTIAAALNSLSTVFTMDIYLKTHKREISNEKINRIGRMIVLIGAFLSVFLAIGITLIQGLSFFNIFQSVLGFLAPPMAAAFLFAVFWKRTSAKAINLTLTAGTVFSIGTGVLYYTGLIFQGLHFLYLSFIIFLVLAGFIYLFSLKDKPQSCSTLDYKPVKINNKVKIAWAILILVMIGLYVFFN
ncbi:Sodium/glucose cotransporter [termite gut metagenome]|uniref:Sodium/glucose cotransporter n=1 Tax=termite gut metagenome TaxID=433724 RepID=A0A5J4T4F4_9ZZZZ